MRRQHVPDKLLYFAACTLGQKGYEKLDLMGIGNDFAPSLKSLNDFKTKFAPDTVTIAAGRDIPIKKGFYTMLRIVQNVRHALKPKKKAKAKAKPQNAPAKPTPAKEQPTSTAK